MGRFVPAANQSAIASAPQAAPAQSKEISMQPQGASEGDKRRLEQQLAGREVEIGRARAEAAAARDRERQARAELEQLRSRAIQAEAAARDRADPRGAAAPAASEEPIPLPGAGSPHLLANLRQRLISEQQRVARLERDLERLRQETSSGPFENKQQGELDAAHKEIADLKSTLEAERQARQDLAARYERLQVQLREVSEARSENLTELQREEISALELRQERALAGIERDLMLSRQREKELSNALAAGQGSDALPLATTVTELRSENSALQVRLDDEHRRNGALAAKLDVAMRVTDLIFKMQSGGAPDSPAPAAVASGWVAEPVVIGGDSPEEPAEQHVPAERSVGGTALGDPVIGPDGEWISSGSD